ncbi:2-phosphoxylose phosphatase 1-like [Guaruba guarouba]
MRWLRPLLTITTEELSPLFNLLKADPDLVSIRKLTPQANAALMKVTPKIIQPKSLLSDSSIPGACTVFVDGSGPYWIPAKTLKPAQKSEPRSYALCVYYVVIQVAEIKGPFARDLGLLKPSHPQLEAFIKHMSKGSAAQMGGSLSSLPRYPSHSLCEMGELTQTGVLQHLKNGQLLRDIYINKHKLLLSDWTAKQLYLETTGKSRTLQSALALLYTFLPDFDWKKINIRHQWSTIFCSGSCNCPMRNHYLEEEQRRQYSLRVKNNDLENIYVDMAKIVGIPTRQLRASNPIDSLLCYFCHNVSFPCTKTGCIDMEHFKVIKRHQLEDERERQEKKLYFLYALLATHPLLNQTVNRLQRIVEGKKEEVFVLYSAHDVTLSPVLSALGITDARFPRFAARLVFELWQDGKRPKDHFIRILYNGADVTFQTSFCRDYYKRSTKPMCPLEKFVNFVKRDVFLIFNSSSYYDACHRRPL